MPTTELEEIALGDQGWNTKYNSSMEKIETNLLEVLQATTPHGTNTIADLTAPAAITGTTATDIANLHAKQTEIVNKINALLAELRSMGVIAT